jgi:protein TonB
MRGILAFIVATLLALPASSQTTPGQPPLPPYNTGPALGDAPLPPACAGFRPIAPLGAGVDGFADVLLHVAKPHTAIDRSIYDVKGQILSDEAIGACAAALQEAAMHPLPEPADKRNNCSAFQPGAPLAANVGGVSLLLIHIAANGEVSNARIRDSSGDDVYDAAAVSCSNGSFLQPARRGGRPIDVDWVGRIDWRRLPPQHAYLSLALQDESKRFCEYPPAAARMNQEGLVAVQFEVAPDGSTRNISIPLTSGFTDLDEGVRSCFAQQTHFPPVVDGKPGTVEMSQSMWLRLK